jgi:hypothetical protein
LRLVTLLAQPYAQRSRSDVTRQLRIINPINRPSKNLTAIRKKEITK